MGTMPPRSGQCGLWCSPLGFLAADACKVASPIHMGIMQSRYEGSILVAPTRRFVRLNAFTNRQLLFVKHWCDQHRFGAVLIVDLPPRAQRCWRAVNDSTGQQQQGVVETPVLQRTVLVWTRAPSGTPVSQLCGASW